MIEICTSEKFRNKEFYYIDLTLKKFIIIFKKFKIAFDDNFFYTLFTSDNEQNYIVHRKQIYMEE